MFTDGQQVDQSQPDPGERVMQCKHFLPAAIQHFLNSKNNTVSLTIRPALTPTAGTALEKGGATTGYVQWRLAPIDILSFLHAVSSHSPGDLSSAHSPAANEFFIRRTGNRHRVPDSVNQLWSDGYGLCTTKCPTKR